MTAARSSSIGVTQAATKGNAVAAKASIHNGTMSTFPVRGCRFFVAALALLALALAAPLAGTAEATTVLYQTDAQLVALSDRVLHGRVLDVRTEFGPDGQTIYTIARLAVLEDLTGVDESIIEVRELGGTIGTQRLWIPGATTYTPGDQLLVCLKQRAGMWRSVAKSFSAFHVESAATGDAMILRRDVTNLDVIAAPVQGPDVRTLDDFRRIVAGVKGTQSVKPAQRAGVASADTPVMLAFTLLGPMRWNKADTGGTVVWYRNSAASAPPTISNIDSVVPVAMQAWTAPTDASITLSYSGARTIGTDTPYCAPSAPGVGVITFEDPTDEIDAPVIAMGGGCSDGSNTVVNGTSFAGFVRAFVVFNNASDIDPSVLTPTNFLRVITHEVGHGVGMGHTNAPGAPVVTNPQSNLMYASCCYSTQPIPPAIGPDDHAGIVFIYPVSTGPGGGGGDPTLTDTDGDGLPDAWEIQYGLNPNDATGVNGASGDPDGDLVTNLQEYQQGTHPRGFVKRYLAEGVVNDFFDTQLALLNPGDVAANVLVRLQTEAGTEKPYYIKIPAHTRSTVNTATLRTLVTGSFATLMESDQVVVLDRTVTWGGGYGSSAETAVDAPAPKWYLAEGATGGPFDVFYLLQNPNTTAVSAQVTYLRPGGAVPLIKSYNVPAKGRLTIWVDDEGFPDNQTGAKLLASSDVSGIVEVKGCPAIVATPNCPIIVERSMYLSRDGQPFAAGHDAAGVTQPNAHWFLAEGATGNFFDMYVLIENPNLAAATVHVSYLLTSGAPLTKDYTVPGNSRFTIFVNDEELPAGSGQHPLQGVTLSTTLEADQPIVVERAMWWPSGNWYEAHDVAGSTENTGTKWAFAEGEQGGSFNTHTYVLIANIDDSAATVTVKAMLEDGTVLSASAVTLAAKSRSTVEIANGPTTFTGVNGKRFGVVVESVNGQHIVVERSMYSDYAGQFWAAGTAALGSCLVCVDTTPATSH
jgi:hypothetical protein